MIRTTIIAGGLLGLGIFTAAPAMAVPGMDVSCSPTPFCTVTPAPAPVPGLVKYYTQTGPGTAVGDFTTAWTQGPALAAYQWATGPARVAAVWTQALVDSSVTPPPASPFAP